jgi:hypothetical protein
MSDDRQNTEEFAAMIAAPLKAHMPLSPDFDARVMAAIAEAAQPWWRRSRTLTLSPLGGLALAAGFGALMVLSGMGINRALTTPVAAVASAADTVHLIRFVIAAPGAQSVALAGDFNGWSRSATQLEDIDGTGRWVVTLPLTMGRHEYAFVVDGKQWVPDPFGVASLDEFGQESSVLLVGNEPVRGA